ncbi:MAG: 16S rRNA (guanine(966)-N(2))-methyltransferase RsmD, partial [Clostridia bacterium]|nr:16S rRNA (guanine(966)-N(2))-methyltransferase RsmD [Clostridia bacterium]
MRIIGGKYRGRTLTTFEGESVRPTADRVKESLFNILSTRLYGAKVLDLFCGSGALGLESLSRGAKSVTFNDCAKTSISILKKNLQKLGIEKEATTYCHDYALCLQLLQGAFDLIFLDPPYAMEVGERALSIIAEKGLLSENGIAVYERDRPFSGKINGLEVSDTRKYGKT